MSIAAAISTSIYAHKSVDGTVHVSFDMDHADVDRLEPPEDSTLSPAEYVEGEFFSKEWADEFIDKLVDERERADRGWEPPRIGNLIVDSEADEIVAAHIENPDNFSPYRVPEADFGVTD